MNVYDKLYRNNENFWGSEVSNNAKKLVDILSERYNESQCILEIGCGEGRDSFFFAEQGYFVTAIDSSKEGINVLQKKAIENNIQIEAMSTKIECYKFDKMYDAVFSIGTLHYVNVSERNKIFERIKKNTKKGGINVISVFCKKPYVKELRPIEEAENLFDSGELMYYYRDWEILFIEEKVKECNSNNIPHTHVKNTIIARRVIE